MNETYLRAPRDEPRGESSTAGGNAVRADAASTAEAVIGDREIQMAAAILANYRAAKAPFDARVAREKSWWQQRHSSAEDGRAGCRPTSAWLFSSVANKHADLCDGAPACSVLPREPGDEAEAALLSDILPVIADRCRFAETYSSAAWGKLKHGLAAYGVFWDPSLENGIGDIDICRIDPLNIFWEPGVSDIQESANLFVVGMEDAEALASRYPALREQRERRAAGDTLLAPELGASYLGAHAPFSGDKCAVVDWYYKRVTPEGRTILHLAKFTGETLLYASENDPDLQASGWYDHGLYPIVLDVLFPEEGTPAGYGLIAVGRNPQGYIDELDGHILEYANAASRVRYWAKRSLGINEKEFLDPDRRIIEVEGDMDEEKLRQITVAPMDGMLCDVRRMKIDELKETTGNRDVSQGSTAGGVTAASAITALQEAGNKGSRDMLAGTYRAYVGIMQQVIELIRQFYDGVRCFRIAGEESGWRFLHYSNLGLKDIPNGLSREGKILYRRPVFDIEVRAEKPDLLDLTGRNQLMLELFRAGVFDPDRREAAELALSGMEFEGIDRVRRPVEGASYGE